MPKVSVVIPVYNVEPYLAECLDSAVSQSLKDIEIICVNDGSTDGSGDILRQYAQADARITVIEQENRGLSGARNTGAESAAGEYLYFLDSDDYIRTDALQGLYEYAQAKELDLLLFDAQAFFEDASLESEYASYKSYYLRSRDYPEVMSGQRLLAEMSDSGDYRPAVWLQFIRSSYYKDVGLSFYEGILHEDNLFSFLCALQAPRAAYIARPYFQRRIRAGSIVTQPKSLRHFTGYFITYLEMIRFAIPRTYDHRTSAVIANLCVSTYQQALKILCDLTTEDRLSVKEIDPSPEGLATAALLVRQAEDQARMRKLKKSLTNSKGQLEKLRGSRTHRFARTIRRLLHRGK